MGVRSSQRSGRGGGEPRDRAGPTAIRSHRLHQRPDVCVGTAESCSVAHVGVCDAATDTCLVSFVLSCTDFSRRRLITDTVCCVGYDVLCRPRCAVSTTAHAVGHVGYALQLLSGVYAAGAPPVTYGCVDVRDVARAHVLAAETAAATGRYNVASSEGSTFLDLADAIRTEASLAAFLPRLPTALVSTTACCTCDSFEAGE